MAIAARVDACDAGNEGLVRRVNLADEKRPQLAGQPPSGFGMARQRREQIEAILHSTRSRARRNHPGTTGVNREAERLRVRVVLRGIVEELIEAERIAGIADSLQIPASECAR